MKFSDAQVGDTFTIQSYGTSSFTYTKAEVDKWPAQKCKICGEEARSNAYLQGKRTRTYYHFCPQTTLATWTPAHS